MKVGILGFGPTRSLAPRSSGSWQWWGMAHDSDALKFDRVFEMHQRPVWERLHGCSDETHARRLNAFWSPLYMRYLYDDIPSALAYPMADVCADLEPPQSSIAAIMSAAILDGASQIGIWGVDMGIGSEYAYQRANMRFLIGYCRSAGIDVVLPAGEKLTDGAEPYGSVEWFAARNMGDERRLNAIEVDEARSALQRALDSLTEGRIFAEPAIGYY